MRRPVRRHIEKFAAAFAITALAACSDSAARGGPITQPTPVVATAVVARVGSPSNALIASVGFQALGADSARIAFQAAGGGTVQHTPYYRVAGTDSIAVLGLLAGTTYNYWVETVTGTQAASSASGSFTTGLLPGDLASYRLVPISGVQHHYIMTGVPVGGGGYAVIFDSTGAIVWYHDFSTSGVPVEDVLMQPNGHLTAFLGSTSGWQPLPGSYVEMTPAGSIVHTYQAGTGSYMDDHEILISGAGASQKAHYFTYTTRQTDLSSIGMGTDVTTAGHQIVRDNAAGAREFTWDAWDNIAVSEWLGDTLAKATRGNSTDFDHPNALTFDNAGNYVVSWRNLDQIMALDPSTGKVLWRLGGTRSDFTIVGDPLGGFYKQHSVKILPNGNVLMFDNGSGHDPVVSRAVEYKLDFTTKTATMVWQSQHTPPLYAQYVGWVDRLANGDTWIAYAMLGRIVEVDPSANTTWEAQLMVGDNPAGVYRLVPLTSLYGFVKP